VTTISQPRVGELINWETAYVGDPALAAKFGAPMVRAFQHLRQYRAGEYVGSYSGRCDLTINGNNANRFHVITRFPVQANAGVVPLTITQKNWKLDYPAATTELVTWYRDYGDGAADITLYTGLAAATVATPDTSNDLASGRYCEWAEGEDGAGDDKELSVTPVAIGVNDGFRCSRLNIDNAMIHRINVFGCPHSPNIDEDEAVVGLADVSVNRVLQGWDHGNDDGTVGAVAHYIDADDSCIHNTCRPLFNTCYALGVYQTGVNPAESLRQDGDGGAQTYMVKPRNLTGSGDKVLCDPAIVVYGGAGAVVTFASTTDSVTYTIPGGGLATPTLVTVSSFTDQLEVDDVIDYITVSGTSAGGIELYVQAVSLWEPYTLR